VTGVDKDADFLAVSRVELRRMKAKLRKLNPLGKAVVAVETLYGLELAAEGFDALLHKHKRPTVSGK
jgi:hypothetical protein